MSTATIQTFTRFSELPSALAVKILSYTPVTNLAFVSKTLHSLQEKAMEQEWRAMKSNPLLAGRISTLPAGDFSPICFRLLLDHQRGLAERTPSGFNAFTQLQRLEVGSYARARFAQGEAIVSAVDREQDDNLWKAWIANGGLRENLAAFLGDAPPQNAAEIRAWMNAPENQTHLDTIRVWLFNNLGLTAFPPELAKCRQLQYILADKNFIRQLPDWFAQFSSLQFIAMRENSLDRVPEVLMRLPNIADIGLGQNPIKTFSEASYRHFYTWPMWLGWNFFHSCGRILFPPRSELAVIPFSLYLENQFEDFLLFLGDKTMKLNTFWGMLGELVSDENLKQGWIFIFGDSRLLFPLGQVVCSILSLIRSVGHCVCSYLSLLPGLTCIGIIWLLSRCYLWAIIPIATWVREQLGYGRMIRLN